MSSALTGNQIKDSYQALLKMGTNGSLDPITPIAISDGLGNDTPLLLSGIEFKTQVVSASKNYGLSLDLSSNSHIYLGDYSIQYNGTSLYVSDYNQLIQTYGLGAQSIGLKLDFLNGNYLFGDFNSIYGYSTYLQVAPVLKYLTLISSDNFLELDGNYNNVWLGNYVGQYNQGNAAVTGNYMFGTDWFIDNNDAINYLFQGNTILNCYNNNLDTETKYMMDNFFINISDPDFDITSNPSFDNKISNCLIFGLTNFKSSNFLNIYSEKQTNTNVVILNGTGIEFIGRTDTYFSVNASEILIEQPDNSGINIIGGDFTKGGDLKTANHRFTKEDSYAINVQGRRAKPINSFSYVTAEYFPAGNTSQGQVQVEEKHLYSYYGDGSVTQFLKDWDNDERLWLQNNSTYRVTATIVSTTGSGDKNETGNSTVEQTWMVCVDSNGNIDFTDYCSGCEFNIGHSLSCELTSQTLNSISIAVVPDGTNGNACHVKGVIKLNCITTG